MERKLRKRTVKMTGEAAPKKTKRSNKEKQPPKEPEIKVEEPEEPTIEAHETPEQLASYKQQLDMATALEETINWYRPKDTSASSNLDMVLDCNHLSSTELEEYFERYRYLLDGIQKGKIENGRHDKYVRYRNDFGPDVERQHAGVRELADKGAGAYVRRALQVLEERLLLQGAHTELCLRIFVDEHGMDESEAIKYLMNKTD